MLFGYSTYTIKDMTTLLSNTLWNHIKKDQSFTIIYSLELYKILICNDYPIIRYSLVLPGKSSELQMTALLLATLR